MVFAWVSGTIIAVFTRITILHHLCFQRRLDIHPSHNHTPNHHPAHYYTTEQSESVAPGKHAEIVGQGALPPPTSR